MERNMNRDVYDALQNEAGFSPQQAATLATAIPDVAGPIQDLRIDMDHKFDLLRKDLDTRFARQRNQTLWATLIIVGTFLTSVAAIVAVAKDLGSLFSS